VTASNILVVAAHPDDETLGCGGCIARHVSRGDRVYVAIVAEGATSRANGESTTTGLRAAAMSAAHVLGAQPPVFIGLPDNRLDGLDLLDIVQHLEKLVDEFTPNTVYTHHGGDLNIDHNIVHRATVTACRPLPGSSVNSIRCFETVSSTEWGSESLGKPFSPTLFVDIADFLETKQKALQCYDAEMRDFPHARSYDAVEALARLRGSQAGMGAAEAFSIVMERRS
jgi:LmbE family N-acetylglucosaminyl deacetylase